MRKLIITSIISAAIAAAGVGCGGRAGPNEATVTSLAGHTIRGTMTLLNREQEGWEPDKPCRTATRGGYADITAGAQVVIKNGSGTIIGTGGLRDGVGGAKADSAAKYTHRCAFSFSVDAVPASDFYVIEVSHRGGISFSASDLAAKNWAVALSLGN